MADPFPGPGKPDPADALVLRPKFNKSHPMAYLLEEVVQKAIAPIVGQTYGSAFMCRDTAHYEQAREVLIDTLVRNKVFLDSHEFELNVSRGKEGRISAAISSKISPASPVIKDRLNNMIAYLNKPADYTLVPVVSEPERPEPVLV